MTNETVLKQAEKLLLHPPPLLEDRELLPFVQSFTDRSAEFLAICKNRETPLWLIEEKVLHEKAAHFLKAFRTEIPEVHSFFAMKSNNHPAVAAGLLKAGMGLDVSGGPELETALSLGCRQIIFSGPGKSGKELGMALKDSDRVTVLLDSFGELRRLGLLAGEAGKEIRAGIRLTTQEKGLWRKFGIPLSELGKFLKESELYPNVRVCGMQFHSSWNLDPSAQTAFIARLGKSLENLDGKYLPAMEFLDIGGGFWPARGEWLQWEGTQSGQMQQLLSPENPGSRGHYCYASRPVEFFAEEIGKALREHIFPIMNCRIFTEPGRWICNDAMHLLMQVQDKKAHDMVICNAGINNIGWERFETDYFPLINLSRPALTEKKCYVFGSLCTPHDIWGYTYFGQGIEEGDILLVPCQGAYTYSLRQHFIKPIAESCVLEYAG